ncbi:MAG: transposase [Balneolaceae bacterium]|nr:transposase [Balneolaceae bacterium]
MNTGFRIYDQYGIYFITFALVNWIDALTRRRYREEIIDSLSHCQKQKGMRIVAYCIMSNHVHLVAYATGPSGLSELLRDFKKYTATQILQSIKRDPESRRSWMLDRFSWRGKMNPRNTRYQFWQQDNHPVNIESHYFMQQKIDYIHENPVRAGWVYRPEDYDYSSAGSYVDETGPLEVEIYRKYG